MGGVTLHCRLSIVNSVDGGMRGILHGTYNGDKKGFAGHNEERRDLQSTNFQKVKELTGELTVFHPCQFCSKVL